jgi:hypothetical protein
MQPLSAAMVRATFVVVVIVVPGQMLRFRFRRAKPSEAGFHTM